MGDIFGLGRIGTIFGVIEIGWGIGAASGPAIGGLIFDLSGSYIIAFVIAGISVLINGLLITTLKVESIHATR
jgi:OFA family oxalate/formate antiporter-like MFS transporter